MLYFPCSVKGRFLPETQSHAAKACESCQVRKEAAVSGVFWVPWERWVSGKRRPFWSKSFYGEAVGTEPSGFLPFNYAPLSGDKLILYPVYICPVEVLERGVFVHPSYYYQTVLVNAFNRNPRLFPDGEIKVLADFDLSLYETCRLEVKVSPELAECLAEYGAVPDNARSWHRIVRNRKVAVRTDKMRLVWHIYAIRGGEAVDTFTGESAPVAALVDTFFA